MSQSFPGPVVLVVDDEAVIRMCIVQMLEEVGCDALEAESSNEALRVIARRRDIDVLFSDITMPGAFDGLELARQVHQSRPAMRLVLTSGKGTPDPSEMPPGTEFIGKPYSALAVARHLRAAA